jgi:hypothetical protein
MLYLKFIIAWFCSPLGLHRSVVEEGLPAPTGMPLGMPPKKTRLHSYGVSTERCIPNGMRFCMIWRYDNNHLYHRIKNSKTDKR